jgi:hypothetical protein
VQWHPIFAHLLRPLVQGHYEVRTDQPVGDLPRRSDVVLLRKTSTAPAPLHGLWGRLTTWNLLEYKGPTVSARLDELHDLLELGLGIHRRLNELQRKEQRPEVGFPEVSFWYLVNHLGRRFRSEVEGYLPGIEQQAAGLWQARVYHHPVFLVSVQELPVERDSLPLHVLAGVPAEARGTVVGVLKAEPSLWASYGAWLSGNEPAIWQEILAMATQQGQDFTLDLGPLADYLRQGGRLQDIKSFLEAYGLKQAVEAVGVKQAVEAVGVKQAVEAVGVKQAVEAVGAEQFWAGLSPEQREELRRLARQDEPPGS